MEEKLKERRESGTNLRGSGSEKNRFPRPPRRKNGRKVESRL